MDRRRVTAVDAAALQRHNHLVLGTDTAIYAENGVVTGFASKIDLIPEWSCALVNRGACGASEIVRQAAPQLFTGFDDMIGGLGDELPRIVKRAEFPHEFELVVAGFSKKRKQPEIWMIRTPGSPSGPGYPPAWRLKRLPNITICPKPLPEVEAAAGFETISESDDPETAVRWLGSLLDVQRQSLVGAFHAIGGSAEVTILTPDKIEQRTIRTWPEDRVDQVIAPSPIDWRLGAA